MECTRPAHLSEEALKEVRRLEEQIGAILVGYEKIPAYKHLAPEELASLQALEQKTGSILVAYEEG